MPIVYEDDCKKIINIPQKDGSSYVQVNFKYLLTKEEESDILKRIENYLKGD